MAVGVGWGVGCAMAVGRLGMAVVDVAVGWVVAVAVTVGVVTAISMVMAVTLAVDMAKEAKNLFTNILILLILSSIGLGISVGTGIIIGFNTFILLALTGTSLPALSMLVYPPLKRRKLIAKYRQSEESLIKP